MGNWRGKNQYRRTFQFFDNWDAARDFIKSRGKRSYTATDWTDRNQTETKVIVWYYA